MRYLHWPSTTIEITAGSDVTIEFQVRDRDGDVVDISSWTFEFQAVDQYDADNRLTIANAAFTITDTTNGKVQMAIDGADTDDQGGKVFAGCLWKTNGAAAEIAHGALKIKRTVFV